MVETLSGRPESAVERLHGSAEGPWAWPMAWLRREDWSVGIWTASVRRPNGAASVATSAVASSARWWRDTGVDSASTIRTFDARDGLRHRHHGPGERDECICSRAAVRSNRVCSQPCQVTATLSPSGFSAHRRDATVPFQITPDPVDAWVCFGTTCKA